MEFAEAESPPTASIWFKEIDRGTESFRNLKRKFRTWDGWSQPFEGEEYLRGLYANHGYHSSRPTFKLLVIAHANSSDPEDDFQRLVWLFAAALSVYSPRMCRRMYFTTAAQIRAAMEQEPYKQISAAAPIWWRLHDARQWLDKYKAFMVALPKGKGQKSHAHMRRLVATRLEI